MQAQPDPRLDRLFNLLPAVHRMQDARHGEPLRALLQVITAELNLVEDDITALYENWFIETCADWVVPYLGELVGWQAIGSGAVRSTAQLRVAAPRRDVANTIRNRRRKGTLALLEQLTSEVSGWPARAVEYASLISVTPALDHPSTFARATVDVRSMGALDGLDGPFDSISRTVDVRRIQATQSGRYNLPSVGVHAFRLRAFSITRAPALCLEEVGPQWYTFSALGNDAPLFARARPELDPAHIAQPANVPHPIGRRALQASVTDYYGVAADGRTGQSFAIWAEDWPSKPADNSAPIPAQRMVVADLSDFQYTPARDQIAVDPVLGRISFPSRQLPKKGVWVSYHHGFSAPIGGGEYARPLRAPASAALLRVQGHEQLRKALEPWRKLDDDASDPKQPADAVIEIADSGVYVLPIQIRLAAGHSLKIRAAQHTRPVLRLLDWQTDRPDSFSVSGGAGSRFTLDGILVAGRGVRAEGELKSIHIRHSTLVPGWTLEPDCQPHRPAEPSIELVDTQACLVVEHSIVGSIQVDLSQVTRDPLRVRIRDSVVDATGSDCGRPECEAIGAPGSARAHVMLEVERSTVIGRVHVHAIARAENSIFTGRIHVARRQLGCMRFCSVAPCSRTPRRYHCQPDEAERALLTAVQAERPGTTLSDPALQSSLAQERLRVRPRFDSLRYGSPHYCRLAEDCAPEIVRGAEDESELGVFHDLYQPQRLASLSARLNEYVPAAADIAVVFAT